MMVLESSFNQTKLSFFIEKCALYTFVCHFKYDDFLNKKGYVGQRNTFKTEYEGIISTAKAAKSFFKENKIQNDLPQQIINKYNEEHQLVFKFS